KPACARRKNALRLGTLPARGGPGKVTASGRRSAATGRSRRTACASPPLLLAARFFRRSVTACSGGLPARNGPTRREVRLRRGCVAVAVARIRVEAAHAGRLTDRGARE